MQFKDGDITTALIDADIMMYRSAWKHEGGDVEELHETIDVMFEHLFHVTKCENYIGFLTGKGNFRKEIAKTKPYKGNRKDMVIPEHLDNARDYLVEQWNCYVVNGLEADDALGICQTKMEKTIICSIDKDLLQIEGLHYNWNNGTIKNVSREEAWLKLYEQTLSGDSTDNIVGIPRVGEKTAKKILADCYDKDSACTTALKAYGNYYKNDSDYASVMFTENLNLVQICTSENDLRLKEKFIIPEPHYVF